MKAFVLVVAAFAAIRGAASYGDILLTGNTTNKGVLEIFLPGNDNVPKFVCSENFNMPAANAACRQLGFPFATKFGPVREFENVDEPTVEPGLTNVDCTSGQNHILRCDYSLIATCAPSDAVAIECSTDEIFYDGQVRLVGEGYTSQGNLQVFANSEWRYVCGDNGFTLANADSVCRQLGYTNATELSLVPSADDDKTWQQNSTCEESTSCFTECFENPPEDESSCTQLISIYCTFYVEDAEAASAGFGCGYFNPGPIVVGVLVGGAALILVVVLVTLGVCVFVPSCLIAKALSRRKYKSVV